MRYVSPFARFLTAALLTAFLNLGAAQAQNRMAEDWLSAAEQTAFAERLAHTHASAERAKIKAEMNRLIQTRQLEHRRKTSK